MTAAWSVMNFGAVVSAFFIFRASDQSEDVSDVGLGAG
jgi:hypothetical protein